MTYDYFYQEAGKNQDSETNHRENRPVERTSILGERTTELRYCSYQPHPPGEQTVICVDSTVLGVCNRQYMDVTGGEK